MAPKLLITLFCTLLTAVTSGQSIHSAVTGSLRAQRSPSDLDSEYSASIAMRRLSKKKHHHVKPTQTRVQQMTKTQASTGKKSRALDAVEAEADVRELADQAAESAEDTDAALSTDASDLQETEAADEADELPSEDSPAEAEAGQFAADVADVNLETSDESIEPAVSEEDAGLWDEEADQVAPDEASPAESESYEPIKEAEAGASLVNHACLKKVKKHHAAVDSEGLLEADQITDEVEAADPQAESTEPSEAESEILLMMETADEDNNGSHEEDIGGIDGSHEEDIIGESAEEEHFSAETDGGSDEPAAESVESAAEPESLAADFSPALGRSGCRHATIKRTKRTTTTIHHA